MSANAESVFEELNEPIKNLISKKCRKLSLSDYISVLGDIIDELEILRDAAKNDRDKE